MRLCPDLRPWQRHSLVLAVAGCVYVGIGVLYLTTPNHDRASSLRWALQVAPMPFWSMLFIAVGTLALISTRWPPSSKTWGYTALMGLSTLWSAAYAVGWAFLGAPLSNLTACLVWALVAFLWWAVAGLVNPDDLAAHIIAEVRAIPTGEVPSSTQAGDTSGGE